MPDAWTTLFEGSTVTTGDAWTHLQNLGSDGLSIFHGKSISIPILAKSTAEQQLEVSSGNAQLSKSTAKPVINKSTGGAKIQRSRSKPSG